MPALSIQAETSVIALAETLRDLRLTHGESQALAAQRIGVGVRTYQRMESTTPVKGSDGVVGIPAGGVAIGDFVMALEVYGVDLASALTQMYRSRPEMRRKRGRTPVQDRVATARARSKEVATDA